MTSKYTNKNGVKLLAVVMVFAMAFAGVALLVPSEGVDATAEETTNVAKIGSTEYPTLEAAVEAVKTGETITLISDVEISSAITFTEEGEYTLDIGSHNVTQTGTGYMIAVGGSNPPSYPFDTINDGVQLTILGDGHIQSISTTFRSYGKIVFGANGIGPTVEMKNAEATHSIFKVEEGSYLTVNGGTFTVGGAVERVMQSFGTTIINNGTFNGDIELWKYGTYTSTVTIGPKVVINGQCSSYPYDELTSFTDDDGFKGLDVRNGADWYASLEDAAAVATEGDVVEVLASTTVDKAVTFAPGVKIVVKDDATLTVNGTITATTFDVYGKLTGTGKIVGNAAVSGPNLNLVVLIGGSISGLGLELGKPYTNAIEVSTASGSAVSISNVSIVATTPATESELALMNGVYLNTISHGVTIDGLSFDSARKEYSAVYVAGYNNSHPVDLKNLTATNSKYTVSIELGNLDGTVFGDNYKMDTVKNVIIWNKSATFKGDISVTERLWIYGPSITLEGKVNLSKGAVLEMRQGSEIKGTIEGPNKNSIVGYFGAGAGGLSITGGSLIINGTVVDGSGTYAGATVTVSGDNIVITGALEDGATMVVESGTNVTVPSDGSFEVKDGAEVTINGNIKNDGNMKISGDVTGTVTNEGTVTINTEETSDLQIDGGIIDVQSDNVPFVADGTEVKVNGKTFIASTVDVSGGYKVMVGAECIAYDGKDHAGRSSVNMKVLAAAVEIDGEYKAFTQIGVGTISVYSMLVYENEADAIAENTNYGVCKDVGTYYMIFTSGLVIEGSVSSAPQVINTYFGGMIEFSIVPKAVTNIEIVGTGANGKIPAQIYTGAPVVPVAGTDYDVYITVNGERIKLTYGVEYDVSCTNNVLVGDSAELTVTLKGNYSGSADKDFEIKQNIVSLDITNTKDTYHVGEKIDTTALVVKGKYQNGLLTPSYNFTDDPRVAGSYILSIGVFDTAGDDIVVTVTSTDNPEVTGTFTVKVVGITSIDVSGFTDEYEVGDDLVYAGMIVTVVYDDGLELELTYQATAFVQTGLVDSDDNDVAGRDFSTKVTFDPTKFISQVGDVTVTATYYGAEDTFVVSVDGFAIIYHVGDEIVATQAGTIEDFAAVYNYVWENSDLFIAWAVEDFGTYYLPGDMIRFGENTAMWGDDDTLNLYAEFFEEPAPVEPTETGIFIDTTGVQIAFAVGDEFSSEGLVVKVIMSDGTVVDATEFDVAAPEMGAADNKAAVVVTYGDFTASYYVAIISSEPAPVEPTPADSVDLYIKKVDGTVKAVIIADEGYVVDGEVVVDFSYTAYDDFAEEYTTFHAYGEAEVVSDLESSVLYVTVDIPTDVSGIYAASATFTAEGINANSGLIFC